MNFVICDDNKIERQNLNDYLELFMKEEMINFKIFQFINAEELIEAFKDGFEPSVVFMDIFMDKVNGMDASKKLIDLGYDGSIIFCTTTPDFAVESYSVNADGYIVKPYKYKELKETLLRNIKKWEMLRRTISFSCERIKTEINIKDIIYIESILHNCIVHTKVKALKTRTALKFFYDALANDSNFLKLDKSHLINLNMMIDYDDDFVYLKNNIKLNLPIKDKPVIKKRLTDFFWLKTRED